MIMDPFEHSDEIHLTLISNAIVTHPENTLFRFKNSLALPLRVSVGDEWEVALQSLSLSNALDYDGFEEDIAEEEAVQSRLKRLTQLKLNEEDLEVTSSAFLIEQYMDSEESMEKIKETLINFISHRDHYRQRFYQEQKTLDEEMQKLKTHGNVPKLVQNKIDTFIVTRARRNRLKRLVRKLNTVFVAYTLNKHLTSLSPVFLELDQIETESGAGKEIAQFYLNGEGPSVFVNYTPTIKCFFPLNHSYLSTIAVNITDLRGHTLRGRAANPSVVNLTLRKKKKANGMNKDGYEYRTCYVRNDDGDHPLNFHADLPSFLSKCGVSNPWEVALVKSSLPHRLLHLAGKYVIQVIERYQARKGKLVHQLPAEEVLDLITKSREDSRYYFKSHEVQFEHNPSADDLIELLSSILGEVDQQNDETHRREYLKFYRFNVRKSGKRIKITANRRLIILLPNVLAVVLGFQNQVLMLDEHYCCLELRDKGQSSEEGAERVPDVSPDNPISDPEVLKTMDDRYAIRAQFPLVVDMLVPQNLLLYADFITPSLVGNAYGQYLTNIPLTRDHSFYSEYSPMHPEYHKLNTNALQRVGFKMLHTDGTVPVLEYQTTTQIISKYQTILTLSFRRRIE